MHLNDKWRQFKVLIYMWIDILFFICRPTNTKNDENMKLTSIKRLILSHYDSERIPLPMDEFITLLPDEITQTKS